jgi:hypothetical protein
MGAAWTSYTPTLTPQSGTLTTASAVGRYKQVGKLIFVSISVTLTNIGTASGAISAALPFTANSSGYAILAGREGASTGTMLQGIIASGSSGVSILTYSNTAALANGYLLIVSGVYEAA